MADSVLLKDLILTHFCIFPHYMSISMWHLTG